MSIQAAIPADAIQLVVGLLLPVLLPALHEDHARAEALALHLLSDYRPRTARELRLAGDAIGNSLRSLGMLAASAADGLGAADLDAKLKSACALSRLSHQAARRLDDLQRRPAADEDILPEAAAPSPEPQAKDCGPVAANPVASPPAAAQPPVGERPVAATPPREPAPPPAVARPAEGDTVEQAEAALLVAEGVLQTMKAHYRGAPPPHSKAAQQIKAQERIVAHARLNLQQARRRLTADAGLRRQAA